MDSAPSFDRPASGSLTAVRPVSVAVWAPWVAVAGVSLLAWGALWNKLRIDWTVNEQYQYGWFVPPLALALLYLRWEDRPALTGRAPVSGTGLAWLSAGLLLTLWPLRMIEEPSPDWRLLFWLHAGVLVALTLCLARWFGGTRWVLHFAFPVLFLLLAVPWPSGPEQAIVQTLMRVVASISAEIMNLLGIPAQPIGNLIQIRDQRVGVDEACSGIRSLQTTLMAGFLLGELSRLSWARRAALLGIALSVAMVANVFRSSLLVWITAQHGAAALEKYHDSAGFSVLVIVFACLVGCNALLSRSAGPPAPAVAPPAHETRLRLLPGWFLVAAASWLLLIEGGTAAWYNVHNPDTAAAHQRWTVLLPADAPDYRTVEIDSRSRQMLRYDKGVSARWRSPDDPAANCTLFFFRWDPGHASISQAELHQPHICLTASGLTETNDWGVHPMALPNGITLPVRSYEFELHEHTIYVFYVIWQDGISAQPLPGEPGSRWDRLLAVWEHRPNLGRQTLEYIVGGKTNIAEATVMFQHDLAGLVHRVN